MSYAVIGFGKRVTIPQLVDPRSSVNGRLLTGSDVRG